MIEEQVYQNFLKYIQNPRYTKDKVLNDLAAQGFMTLGDLGARFSCPAIDVEVMKHFLQLAPRQLWGELAAYGATTLAVCLLFLFHAGAINTFLLKGGVLSAAAIMASAAVVAWSYGKTLECLFNLTKADIY